MCSSQIHHFVTSCKESTASHCKINTPFPLKKSYKLAYCNTQKYHLRKRTVLGKTCLVLLMPLSIAVCLFEQARVSVFKIVSCRLLSCLENPFLFIISIRQGLAVWRNRASRKCFSVKRF